MNCLGKQIGLLGACLTIDHMFSLPVLKPASQLQAPETQVTTLPNGLRVVTQETYGQAATLGLFVDAGSRFEDGMIIGILLLAVRMLTM